MSRSSPRSHSDIRGVSAATLAANRLTSAPDRQRLRTVVQQPPSGPVDEPAQVQRHPIGHRNRHARVTGGPDLPPHLAHPEDRVGGHVAAHRVDRADADVLGDPEGVGDPTGVDEIVDQHRGDDLAAQLMSADLGGEVLAQLGREVVGQPGGEHLLVGQVGGQQFVLERQLDVRHQRRELGRRQPQTRLRCAGRSPSPTAAPPARG